MGAVEEIAGHLQQPSLKVQLLIGGVAFGNRDEIDETTQLSHDVFWNFGDNIGEFQVVVRHQAVLADRRLGLDDYMLKASPLGDVDALLTYTRAANISWVRAGHLFDLRDAQQLLSRNQETTTDAFCTPYEVRDWCTSKNMPVVVSHPWWTRQHPDPQGVQLAQICKFLEHHIGGQHGSAFARNCPVFFDYVSLPQVSWEYQHEIGNTMYGRREDEEDDFRLAMSHMYCLYAHDCTLVLRLNGDVPDFNFDSKRLQPNRAAYHERGWCVFEHRVSDMKAYPQHSISFPLWLANQNAEEARNELMTVEDFRAELQLLHFTNGRTDRETVSELYARVCELRGL